MRTGLDVHTLESEESLQWHTVGPSAWWDQEAEDNVISVHCAGVGHVHHVVHQRIRIREQLRRWESATSRGGGSKDLMHGREGDFCSRSLGAVGERGVPVNSTKIVYAGGQTWQMAHADAPNANDHCSTHERPKPKGTTALPV